MAWGDGSPHNSGGARGVSDPLLVPSPLPSRTSPPGQAQSIKSVVGPTTPNQRSLLPPSLWEERPPEGTALLFSQEQLHQLRRLHQASSLLQGPPQAQEEQTSSSNTTNIQEEVRRQVSDFMSQQTQAMHRLQSENEALRERLQVRPPHLTKDFSLLISPLSPLWENVSQHRSSEL